MSVLAKLLQTFVKRTTHKARSATNLDTLWESLSNSQRARVARALRSESKKDTKLAKNIRNTLEKDFFGKPLKQSEREFLNSYEKMTDNPVEKVEWLEIRSRSGNFKSAAYYKASKRCVVHMRRGVGFYTFYQVPRTKWLALCEVGGEYMWDLFGRRYSTNPTHWIRTGPMNRYSTANHTNTKSFKQRYRRLK